LEEAKKFSERTFAHRKEGEKTAKTSYEEELQRSKEDHKERLSEESDEDFEIREDL
jgi:hypothetical protein